MKITVNAYMMKETMVNRNRDDFTFEGLETLLNWYDDCYGENFEFDPIAICCDWNEYGDTPCLTWNDFLNDYEYLLEDIEKVLTEEEKIDLIIETLEDRTTVIRLSDSVLVGAF